MPHPINVGIVGYGSSANIFHLPYILPNPDLRVHAFLQRAEAPQEPIELGTKHCTIDYPRAKHYRTAEAFFNDAEIELVVVCTGHNTHASFAEQALLAGKHVVVEKPFTITSAEADHLISTARQASKILMCFQNRRYDSDFLTLRHLISSQNSFGKLTEFENHYSVDNPPWIHSSKTSTAQPGDGLLYGLGSHSIDQTLLLFGRPSKITAFTRSLLVSNGADDSFTIILQYATDLLVTIKTAVVIPLPTHKILKYRVLGTEGTWHKYGEDVQVEQFLDGVAVEDEDRFGVEPERYHGHLSTRSEKDGGSRFDGTVKSQRGRYVDYYRDVVAAVRGEREVVCKAEEARDVIRLIELARESAEKGITVEWTDG